MPRPEITLIPCADGLSPQFTSLFPLGDRPYISGGTSALEWVTNGNLSDGDLITVRTDGTYSFGEPENRSQSLQIIGESTFANGVPNNWLSAYSAGDLLAGRFANTDGTPANPSSPYYSISGIIKSTVTRHANIGMTFKCQAFTPVLQGGSEASTLMWPQPFVGDSRVPSAGDRFYASWVFYNYTNGDEVNVVKYASKTGSFSVGSNTMPARVGDTITGGVVGAGERVSCVSGLGKTANGYVTLDDTTNSMIYVNLDTEYIDWGQSDWEGAVITGTVSGAIATCKTPLTAGTEYINQGATKSGRILQNTNVGLVDTATNVIGVDGSTTGNVFYDATSTSGKSFLTKPTSFAWHRRQVWVDYRDDGTGKVTFSHMIDGTFEQVKLDKHLVRSDIGPVLATWGIEANVMNGHTALVGELKAHTDSLTALISSSATWAGVDMLEAEPLIRVNPRTETRADFKLSRGVFSGISGKYLYVLAAPNTPLNSNGLLLTGA